PPTVLRFPRTAHAPPTFASRSPPRPPLFPYTTLFRSGRPGLAAPLPRRRRGGRRHRLPQHGLRPHARPQGRRPRPHARARAGRGDRKSTRLNSSHVSISYAVFCLKKKREPAHAAQLDL